MQTGMRAAALLAALLPAAAAQARLHPDVHELSGLDARDHAIHAAEPAGPARQSPTPEPFPHLPRTREADLLSLRLDLDLDLAERRISGSVTHVFSGISKPTSRLTFDQGGLVLRAARDGDGRPLAFDAYRDRVVVQLARALRAGERATVVLDYAAAPRDGMWFSSPHAGDRRGAPQVWTHGETSDNRKWFPTYDSPDDRATFEIRVTVPRGMSAVANGALLSRSPVPGNRTEFHYKLASPQSTYLAFVAAGDYAVVRDAWRGKPVEYWVPRGREEEGRVTFGRTPRILELFSRRFGAPYPYEKYAQVICYDFVAGGMENTSVTAMSENLLHDARHRQDSNVDGIVSHEAAHQWFGDLLTCRDWGEIWLNEGFATYGERIWREHAEGRDVMLHQQLNATGQIFAADRRRPRPIVWKRYASPGEMFDSRSYAKGAWVLHMLRRELGEDGFWRALRRYTSENRERTVVTEDLQRACEAVAGRTLAPFFHQWLHRPGFPEVHVGFAWSDEARRAELTVRQRQEPRDGVPEAFRFETEVEFECAEGSRSFPLKIEEREHVFQFPLPSRPRTARFDPGLWLLKELHADFPVGMWTRRATADPEAVGRIEAVRALASLGGSEAADAIAHVLRTDVFWGARQEAARALQTSGGRRAVEALRAGLADKSSRVRTACADAAGALSAEAAVLGDDLARLSREDDSYAVRSSALRALARLRAPRAFDAALFALEIASPNDMVRVAAVEALATLGHRDAWPYLLDGLDAGRSQNLRSAAAGHLARLGRLWKRVPEARAALVSLLRDPGRRNQLSGIFALRSLGDPRAAEDLDDLARTSAYDGSRDLARQSATILREGKAEWPDGLEKKVRALHESAADAAGGSDRPRRRGDRKGKVDP